jgi:hypothetical protein
MRKWFVASMASVTVLGIVSWVSGAENKAKTIKEVMKAAHGGGANSLLAKVASGKGSKEDAEKLLALYEDLAKNDAPRGDAAAWKKKNDEILKQAKAVVNGDAGAGAKLRAAANCMNCHKDHKPAD